eukprot:gene12744-6936_t
MVSLLPSVLLIDSDEDFCHTTETLLNSKYRVNCCNSIEESIKIFNTFSIDLILINYLMKKEKKFIDFINLIKKNFKDFPVIMISENEKDNVLEESNEIGAQDFLFKPINNEILRKRIKTSLELSRRKKREKELKSLLIKEKNKEKENEFKLNEIAVIKKKVEKNIETPMSNVIEILSNTMNSKLDKDNMKKILIKVSNALSRSDLYKPAFVDYLDNTMDPEIRLWLSTECTNEKSMFSPRNIKTYSRKSSGIQITEPLPFSLKDLNPKVNLNDYGFDVFKYSKLELRYFIVFMMKSLDFFDKFMIEPSKFWRLLLKVEKCYNDNIYHNFYHCFDVTQYVYTIILNPEISKVFNDFEKFCLLISALLHDTDHPGLNNNYLINSRDDLSLIYNDQSVLEMHHCRESFKILSDEKYNILSNLTNEENHEFRKIFIELVLSTDMSQHFTFLSKFKSFSTNKTINEFNELEKLELMKLILKASDVGNVTRPFLVARKWAKLCIREFISQGDLEKKYNLPLGVLNDRNNLNFPKSQLGFVEYIAGSLFIELVQLFPTLKNIAKEIEINKKIWQKLLQSNKIDIDSEYDTEKVLKYLDEKDENIDEIHLNQISTKNDENKNELMIDKKDSSSNSISLIIFILSILMIIISIIYLKIMK